MKCAADSSNCWKVGVGWKCDKIGRIKDLQDIRHLGASIEMTMDLTQRRHAIFNLCRIGDSDRVESQDVDHRE